MLQLYSELIKQQNTLILRLHKLLYHLKGFILKIETKIRSKKEKTNNPKLPDIEYIFKDIILQFLNFVKIRDNYQDLLFSSNENQINQIEISDYKKEKRLLFEKLEKRAKFGKEKNKEIENIQTFGYEKPDKNKSFFSWK